MVLTIEVIGLDLSSGLALPAIGLLPIRNMRWYLGVSLLSCCCLAQAVAPAAPGDIYHIGSFQAGIIENAAISVTASEDEACTGEGTAIAVRISC
jgi:hypothetical protein